MKKQHSTLTTTFNLFRTHDKMARYLIQKIRQWFIGVKMTCFHVSTVQIDILLKSRAYEGLRNRDSAFFEELYFTLMKKYHSFLSDRNIF